MTPISRTTKGDILVRGRPLVAGVLTTVSRFLGATEDAARLIEGIVRDAADASDLAEAATRRVDAIVEAGGRIPGMGHNLHEVSDPRVQALLDVSEREGTAGRHVEALDHVAAAARCRVSDRLVLNAAAAVAALLGDLGYGAEKVRGLTLVARCAGLFAHVVDEREQPLARRVWQREHDHGEHT